MCRVQGHFPTTRSSVHGPRSRRGVIENKYHVQQLTGRCVCVCFFLWGLGKEEAYRSSRFLFAGKNPRFRPFQTIDSLIIVFMSPHSHLRCQPVFTSSCTYMVSQPHTCFDHKQSYEYDRYHTWRFYWVRKSFEYFFFSHFFYDDTCLRFFTRFLPEPSPWFASFLNKNRATTA